jgi:hypothetical protein
MTLLGAAEVGLSLGVAVAVVSLPCVIYRVLFGSWGTWHPSSVRARVPFLMTALIVVFYGEFLACKVCGLPVAGILGGSVLAAYVAYYNGGPRRIRRVQALCRALLDRSTREASLASLERELTRWRARVTRSGFLPPSESAFATYARTALDVGQRLGAAGLSEEAVRMLEGIDESRLSLLSRAKRTHVLAVCRLRGGDRRAAREELSRIPRPVPDVDWEDAVASLDALLLALEGDPREAETRARLALERVRVPAVRASLQSALAHSLAAQGLRDDAEAILREMQETYGHEALARVVRHAGAASPIAETLQAASGTPYR